MFKLACRRIAALAGVQMQYTNFLRVVQRSEHGTGMFCNESAQVEQVESSAFANGRGGCSCCVEDVSVRFLCLLIRVRRNT